MRLRLVEAAHDAERDPLIALLHEAGNDRVQRTRARPQRIRLSRLQREAACAILQHEARSLRHQPAAERSGIALDQRNLVALVIHHRKIGRIARQPRQLLVQLRGQHIALRAVCDLRGALRAQAASRSTAPPEYATHADRRCNAARSA